MGPRGSPVPLKSHGTGPGLAHERHQTGDVVSSVMRRCEFSLRCEFSRPNEVVVSSILCCEFSPRGAEAHSENTSEKTKKITFSGCCEFQSALPEWHHSYARLSKWTHIASANDRVGPKSTHKAGDVFRPNAKCHDVKKHPKVIFLQHKHRPL